MDHKNKSGCSHQTDFNQNDRPLKKAKYVWEVKGKYHLKSNDKSKMDENGKNISCGCDKVNSIQNEGYKEKCIDALLAKTESILDSDEDNASQPQNIETSISSEIPITLITPKPHNEEYYLQKWQAKQLARAYIDNTINSVLENWSTTRIIFDAEDFVENCINDGHVEDEGILMAIQAHGLHPKQSQRRSTGGPEQHNSTREKLDIRNEKDFVYPVDVLNTAILVAIEKEGLSSTSSS